MKKQYIRMATITASAGLVCAAAVLWAGSSPETVKPAPPPAPLPVLSPEPSLEMAPIDFPSETKPTKNAEEKRFARTDRDDDGTITMAEYLHNRKRNFDKLDTNRDGKLSFEEYSISGIKKFQSVDTNRNGKLDAKEYEKTAIKRKSSQSASSKNCPPVKSMSPSSNETPALDEPNLNE